MKRVKKLILNTAVLTASALFVRTAGLWFNAYITKIIGAAGMGLFGLISTVYGLCVTFASSGIRTATTRLLLDESERGGSGGVVVRRCLIFALAVSFTVAALAFFLAPYISGRWIGDMQAAAALRILSASLPFTAASAVLSGYFLTKGSSVRMAAIQISELAVRIAVCAALLPLFAPRGLAYACAAIAAGFVLAEAASCLFAWTLCAFDMRKRKKTPRTAAHIARKIAHIALPEAAGAWIKSIFVTVEHMLIPIGLRRSGSSAGAALSAYGLVSQMALPLLLYPSCILGSLSTLLIPETARSHILGNRGHIRYMTRRALRFAIIFSFGTAGFFLFFSRPLAQAVYNNTQTAVYLRLFAPLVPVMYIDTMVDGILKGLDQQLRVMRISILDAAISTLLVWVLVPKYALTGYIAVIFAGEILNFYLSMRALIRTADIRLRIFHDVVLPAVCVCGAMVPVYVFFDLSGKTAGAAAMVCAAALYYAQMRLTGCIDREDADWIRSVLRVRRPSGGKQPPR